MKYGVSLLTSSKQKTKYAITKAANHKLLLFTERKNPNGISIAIKPITRFILDPKEPNSDTVKISSCWKKALCPMAKVANQQSRTASSRNVLRAKVFICHTKKGKFSLPSISIIKLYF